MTAFLEMFTITACGDCDPQRYCTANGEVFEASDADAVVVELIKRNGEGWVREDMTARGFTVPAAFDRKMDYKLVQSWLDAVAAEIHLEPVYMAIRWLKTHSEPRGEKTDPAAAARVLFVIDEECDLYGHTKEEALVGYLTGEDYTEEEFAEKIVDAGGAEMWCAKMLAELREVTSAEYATIYLDLYGKWELSKRPSTLNCWRFADVAPSESWSSDSRYFALKNALETTYPDPVERSAFLNGKSVGVGVREWLHGEVMTSKRA